jgi:hypothetical protein
LASMCAVSASPCRCFTLPLRVFGAGDDTGPAKSRSAGGLLRIRRLRIGPPAHAHRPKQ